ncbi:MAG: hypothetical protein ACOC44_10845 [Promethearchaeia archaeon]
MIDRKLFEILSKALGTSYVKEYPDKFRTRLIVQKTLYLLTHGSSNPQTNLSYKWNFYLRGPYSPEISHMIYHMTDVWDDISNKQVKLKEKDLESIENFKKLLERLEDIQKANHDFQSLERYELFEALATLTYFTGQLGNNFESVQKKFRNFKPELSAKISDKNLQLIFRILEEYGYI